MKKANIIIVAVIYVASIALISFFGMEIAVLDPIVPVTEIQCINEEDNFTTIGELRGNMLITLTFTTAGNAADLSGTILQLYWRVYPDNASNSEVKFVYDTTNTSVTFITDSDGRQTGTILFASKTIIDVDIVATDGTKVSTTITIAVV